MRVADRFAPLIVLLCVGALCATVEPARAQDASHASEDAAAEAMRLFEESRELYRDGRFADAAQRLERAYALDPAPVLLYNLARAYEGEGRLTDAVEHFRRYLDADPETSDRGAIERRIETLTRQLDERRALERELESRPEDDPAPAPTPVARPSPLPWIVAGVGALTVGAGAAFGVLASSKHDEAVDEPSFEQAFDAQDQAETFATVANVMFAAGGALALGGVVWGIVDLLGSGTPTEDQVVVVHAVAGGAALAVSGALP